jgi:eukaryotic-like serine/threonine-protein kinase
MAKNPSDSSDPGHTIDEADDATQLTEATALAPRYVERDRLGHGGMGEVLLVHDSLIGRDVALKRLRKTSVKARHRFAREARLQGRLEHPAIAPVYDLQANGAAPFFTMKRVRGVSLRAVLTDESQPRLSQRRLLSALSQVCLAVHYAHESGVVHRDIKPDNVMLGDYGEVYLLDWGIAKVAGDGDHPVDEVNDTQVNTRAGELLGSVHYMAPEQIKSEPGGIDARADVYALGGLLFEILTRQRLHEPAPLEKMVEKILAGIDTRARVQKAAIAVPPELEAICVQATRRDPRERFASARALHDAIERYLDGDRDAELRRDGARNHAELARHAAVRALAARSSDEESACRADALRAVGQALAFDASNPEARQTLVQLLTTPPRHLPPEVQKTQQENLKHHIRRAAGLGALVYVYLLVNILFMYSHSIRSWSGFWPAHALWVGAMISAAATALRPRYLGLFAMLVFGVAASVEATRVLSPMLAVPGLLAAHAVIFSLFNDVRQRIAAVGIVVVGWTLAAFGEPLGLFPRTITPMNGGLFIDTSVVELARVFTAPMMWAAFLAMMVLPAIVVGAMRTAYGKADLQLRLQTWQLGQLLPDDKRR